MKSLKNIEEVGWIFWVVVFALLVAPGIYLAYSLTYDTASTIVRVGFGLFMAAMGSGLVSWLVNEVLQRVQGARKKKNEKKRKGRKTKK